MTAEMGKPLVQARAEAAKCATAMRFYADHAELFLAPQPLPWARTSIVPDTAREAKFGATFAPEGYYTVA